MNRVINREVMSAIRFDQVVTGRRFRRGPAYVVVHQNPNVDAIGLGLWPRFARLTRCSIRTEKCLRGSCRYTI